METVIAKTKKGFMASYIVIIVFGAILLLFGMIFLLFTTQKYVSVVFIPMGGVLLGIGIGFTVYFARLPKNCITFGEGKMRLHNGLEFSPAEIDYCTGSTMWLNWGLYSNIGVLIISVRHQEYKYKFVVDVEKVAAHVNSLKMQFTAIEEMQKHIAEKKAAEAAQATESANTTENKD